MNTLQRISFLWLLLASLAAAVPNILIEGWDGVQWKNITDNDLNPNQQVTDFDDVDYNSFSNRIYRIRNTGNQNLTVSVNGNSASSTSSQFTFPGFPTGSFSVAPGSTNAHQFTIRYTPVTVARTSTIRIDSNSGNSGSAERIYTFAVKGAAREGIISVTYNPSSGNDVGIAENGSATASRGTDFGAVRVGGGSVSNATRTRSFYVRNSSSATDSLAFLATPTLTGAGASHFQIISLGTTRLNPGNNRNFQIRFDPSSPGIKNAVLTIRSNDVDDDPFRVNLRGEGTAFSEIRVQGRRVQTGATFSEIVDGDNSPRSADGTLFNNTDVGEFEDTLIRVHNDGDRTLTLSGHGITGGGAAAFQIFSVDGAVVAGESQDFTIRFRPGSTGTFNAVFTMNTNDTNESPFNFSLRGTGLAPEIAVEGRDTDGIYRDIADGGGNSPSNNNGTNFGNQDISGGAAQRSFRIRNTGNKSLKISSRRFIGDGDGEFSVSGLLSFGVRNVAAGATHTFTISYDPENLGTDNAIFEMTTDDPSEGIFTYDLRGIGIGFAEIRVEGKRQQVGTTYDEIFDNDTSSRPEDGTRFNNTEVGSSRDSIFKIHNDGDSTLTLSGFTMTGDTDAFAFLGLDGGVSEGKSEDFEIRFTPPSAGTFNATVIFRTNDPNEDPFNFVIRGSGLAPEITVRGRDTDNIFQVINDGGGNSPSTNNGTEFGNQDIAGGAAQRIFRITNSGNSDLKITSREFIGDGDKEYSVSNLLSLGSRTVKVGASHDFTISYNPENLGTDTVIFSMRTNDPNEDPFTFDLRGTGVGFPEIRVRGITGAGLPFDINDGDLLPDQDVTKFGNVSLGTEETRTFRVVNDGLASLTVSSIQSSDSSFSASGLSRFIPAGGSDDFTITYRPPGIVTDDRATITIRSDVQGINDPYTFAVTGNGIGPIIEVFGGIGNTRAISDGDSTPSVDDGTIFEGVDPASGSITKTFLIKNTGNRELNIQLASTFVGGQSGSFSFDRLYRGNPLVTIVPGGQQVFDIIFDPIQVGNNTTVVRLQTNAEDSTESYTFSVTGLGLEPGASPDIEVTGTGSRIIASGDSTPRLADGTSFGTVDETDSPITKTFTIHNRSVQSVLNISGVSVSIPGGRPARYTVGNLSDNDLAPGGSATFTVTLDPSLDLGGATGTVTISSDDPDTASYTFAVLSSIREVEEPTGRPIVKSLQKQNGDLVFVVEGSGTFKITTSTTLAGPWVDVPGQTGLTSGSIRLSDVLDQGNSAPRRFYRVELEGN